METFFREQLPNVLIAKLSSSYQSQLNAQTFYGTYGINAIKRLQPVRSSKPMDVFTMTVTAEAKRSDTRRTGAIKTEASPISTKPEMGRPIQERKMATVVAARRPAFARAPTRQNIRASGYAGGTSHFACRLRGLDFLCSFKSLVFHYNKPATVMYSSSIITTLQLAKPPQRKPILNAYIRELLANFLGMDGPEDITPIKALSNWAPILYKLWNSKPN